MRVKSSLIYGDLCLFAHNLFNCFARVWFFFFAHNYTLILFIYVQRNLMIFLKILLSPIFILLWVYTITIDSNVCNVFEMYSVLFRKHCTFFLFLVTTINISFPSIGLLHVIPLSHN